MTKHEKQLMSKIFLRAAELLLLQKTSCCCCAIYDAVQELSAKTKRDTTDELCQDFFQKYFRPRDCFEAYWMAFYKERGNRYEYLSDEETRQRRIIAMLLCAAMVE